MINICFTDISKQGKSVASVNIDIHHHHYTVEYKAVNSTAHLELYDKVSQ